MMEKSSSGKENEIELKVAEAIQEDINKGIARLSSRIMAELGIVSGDLIEVASKNSLIVKSMRSEESEETSIRLDGNTRSDLNTSLGEKVKVRRAEKVNFAKEVVLAPLQELRLSSDSSSYFHFKLLDLPLRVKQNLVILASSKKLR